MSSALTENLLGYAITRVACKELIADISGNLSCEDGAKTFMCANPHSLVVADSDREFRQALRQATWLVPDGAGILLASKLLGGSMAERVTGSDVFRELNRVMHDEHSGMYSCFFLGSSEETLAKIRKRMEKEYPGVRVAGTYSPPFKEKFSEADNQLMIGAINRAKPDILWVGLTAPKQEKWIAENRGRLDVKFIGAVGAVFDFYAGNIQRSHPVFQKMGLEWLPRLLQEPRRLFKRNFVSSPLFIYEVLKERFRGA